MRKFAPENARNVLFRDTVIELYESIAILYKYNEKPKIASSDDWKFGVPFRCGLYMDPKKGPNWVPFLELHGSDSVQKATKLVKKSSFPG
jgi:hypothetical protein